MALSFRGNQRGLIYGLQQALLQLQRSDARAQTKADAKGTVPLLYVANADVSDAVAVLLARCEAALAQSI